MAIALSLLTATKVLLCLGVLGFFFGVVIVFSAIISLDFYAASKGVSVEDLTSDQMDEFCEEFEKGLYHPQPPNLWY